MTRSQKTDMAPMLESIENSNSKVETPKDTAPKAIPEPKTQKAEVKFKKRTRAKTIIKKTIEKSKENFKERPAKCQAKYQNGNPCRSAPKKFVNGKWVCKRHK